MTPSPDLEDLRKVVEAFDHAVIGQFAALQDFDEAKAYTEECGCKNPRY